MQWDEFRFHIRHLPADSQNLVRKAFEIGADAHKDQKRQSGEPYFTHPIAVAQMLANMGGDTDTIIAALLHDTVEDTPLDLATIEAIFGKTVAMLIDGVTKLSEKDLEARPSVNEQVETLRKMFTLMEKDVRIMVIKLADRLHNMQTISFRSPEKQQSVAQETMDVYVKIADRLCMRDTRDELEAMCLAILDPVGFAKMKDLLKRNEEKSGPVIAHLADVIHRANNAPTVDMIYERKSWSGLKNQMETNEWRDQQPAVDLAFVCDSVEYCYQILGILHGRWRREVRTFEDFINIPAINGYKAIHTTIILEDGIRVRCKIRTKEMDEYAHRGITMVCFDTLERGVLEYLPWTSRISPLSQDTFNQSQEFWESLQSDILGESIAVHGDTDQMQLLPKGSTALDAVFYLYGERGLRTRDIYINGKLSHFYDEVPHASTIHADLEKAPQVRLGWLQYTRSGMGTALIRKGLARQEPAVKLSIGQHILQEHFNTHRRGFINELDRTYIDRTLKEAGYPGLEDMYIQIAEGRASPQEVEKLLFQTQKATESDSANHWYTLTIDVPNVNRDAISNALKPYSIRNFRMLSQTAAASVYRLSLMLTGSEHATLTSTLDFIASGKYSLRRSSAFYKAGLFSVILFALWGLDPAMAYLLLHRPGIGAVDMTILRFVSQAILSGFFLLWIRTKQPLPQARLSLSNPSLWLTAGFLFCVALSTYASLAGTLPSHYSIPMTSAGLILTTIVNRRRVWTLAATWLLVLAGIGLLIGLTPEWDGRYITSTLLAVVAFTGFSLISERYKRQEQVSSRAAQYFFLLSVFCSLLSITLLPVSTLGDIALNDLFWIIFFSTIVSGLPYYIYYYLLSHKEIDFVLRYSFLIIPTTIISELLLLKEFDYWTMLSAILVMVGAFLPLIQYKKTS